MVLQVWIFCRGHCKEAGAPMLWSCGRRWSLQPAQAQEGEAATGSQERVASAITASRWTLASAASSLVWRGGSARRNCQKIHTYIHTYMHTYIPLSCGADRFSGRLKGGWCGDWPPTPLPLLHLQGRGRTNRTLGLAVLDGPPSPTRGRRAVSPAWLPLAVSPARLPLVAPQRSCSA